MPTSIIRLNYNDIKKLFITGEVEIEYSSSSLCNLKIKLNEYEKSREQINLFYISLIKNLLDSILLDA